MSSGELVVTIQPLSEGVWRCAAPDAICSSVIFAGEHSVLVADSMLTPSLARQVKEAARELTGKPVRYLLNTHGDSDHVCGNQEFWPESILLSHRLTRERLLTDGEKLLQAAKAARPWLASELDQVRIVAPELAFEGGVEFDLGGMSLECIYLGPAHTPGDVAVWEPEQRVVFAGDLVFNRIFPVMRNADVAGWLNALDRLEALRPERVVAGHGEVGGSELIGEMRELLIAVRSGVGVAIAEGLTLEQALETVRFPLYESLPRARERIPEAIGRLYVGG